jgi:hypothetical protein
MPLAIAEQWKKAGTPELWGDLDAARAKLTALRELALDILADAEERPDPESPTFVITWEYMNRLMHAAGFPRGIADAERALDPQGTAERDAAIQAAMAEGDAGPYEGLRDDVDWSALEADGPVPPPHRQCGTR